MGIVARSRVRVVALDTCAAGQLAWPPTGRRCNHGMLRPLNRSLRTRAPCGGQVGRRRFLVDARGKQRDRSRRQLLNGSALRGLECVRVAVGGLGIAGTSRPRSAPQRRHEKRLLEKAIRVFW